MLQQAVVLASIILKMDALECAVCHSHELREHHLGFLVCEVCGNQASTQVVMMEETKATPLKRTLRNVTQKQKKEKKKLVILDGEEYLRLYKQYLDLCVKDMIKECGIESTVIDHANHLWTCIRSKQVLPEQIKPKNSES